jgi:DNA topoisomerase IB
MIMTARGPAVLADPVALVRSELSGPGILRKRHGRGFRYLGSDGTPVRDPEVLARIKALVIPPAWEDVWICVDPQGHTQAIGTDAAGRRQYRYHDLWRENYRSERAGLLSPRGGALSLRFVSSRASELRLANIRSGLPVAD